MKWLPPPFINPWSIHPYLPRTPHVTIVSLEIGGPPNHPIGIICSNKPSFLGVPNGLRNPHVCMVNCGAHFCGSPNTFWITEPPTTSTRPGSDRGSLSCQGVQLINPGGFSQLITYQIPCSQPCNATTSIHHSARNGAGTGPMDLRCPLSPGTGNGNWMVQRGLTREEHA